MKNLFILPLLILNLMQLHAQDWIRQHPFPVSEQMHDIEFDEEGHGWVVGGNSTILYTENWGVNWAIQEPVNYGIVLLSLAIVPNTGGQKAFIGGNTMLKTEDAGENWEQVFGFTNPIDQLFALDEQNIFSFGYNNTSRKSTDGGDTWIDFPNPAESGSTVGWFLDTQNGWASGGTYNNAQMYRTFDGGDNWTLLDTTRHAGIQSVRMLDNQKGFFASGEHIFKTLDGGNTWNIISDQSLPSVTDLYVISEQEIWASMHNGSVYFTLDGGTTWTLNYPEGGTSRVNCVYAISGGQAWLGGKYTSVMYTGDASQNWQSQTPGNRSNLNDINFHDEDNGYACGGNGTLLKTDDGGAVWQDISQPAEEYLLAIEATSPQIVYVLSNQNELRKTTDGGQSWTIIGQDITSSSYGMTVIDDQHICVYSQFGDIGVTTNGGTTWTQVSNPGVRTYDMSFPTDNIGWIASDDGNLLKTTDGGLNWTTVSINETDDLHTVHFVDEMYGWATGRYVDSLFHTADGGNSWTVQMLPQATYWQEISFMDRDTGWIVGGSSGHSKIVATTDGGATWDQVYSDGSQLQGVSVLNNNKVWAAGAGGNIVHFSSCNVVPELTNLVGSEQVCQGDTLQYSVDSDNVAIFNWELPDDWIFLSNTNAATIEVLVGEQGGSVQLVGENNCELTTDEAISINVSVDATTDLDLAVNNNVLDVSPQGESYTWLLNGQIVEQSNNNSYTAQQSGLYHVIVDFATGCSATSDIVNVMVTSNENLALEQVIQLFPNPNQGVFELQLPQEISNAEVRVLDNTARPILKLNIEQRLNIDLSKYQSGLYHLEIRTDKGIFYKRVLVL